METKMTAAPRAGAHLDCARTQAAEFRPVLRKDLLLALKIARKRLGLTDTNVSVLATLLSFLPCQDQMTGAEVPVTHEMLLVIFASNAAICERANGMGDRKLRRNIDRLVAAGLVRRKDSATGKRFPIRASGKIIDAYGIDISPLLLAADRIIRLARQIKAEEEEIRGLRAQALALRAELLRRADTLGKASIDVVEGAKTVLRRVTLGVEGVRAVHHQLLEIAKEAPYPNRSSSPDNISKANPTVEELRSKDTVSSSQVTKTISMSGADGQNVRQVETYKIEIKKETKANKQDFVRTEDASDIWFSLENVSTFFPDIPKSLSQLQETVYLLGRFIALSERTLAKAIASMGWTHLLKTLDYLIGNASRIRNPDGYLTRIIAGHQTKQLQP
ncbi:plasmid replication protein RepC [Leisingera caerulea]|uniref:plasmid replication protein RepC n=1 Tax=Leisingera caerulea TaxID=506591 RepID=UPI0021A46953|nr:plasmid replication protein RepC [Leisingera caerulea]UWQ85967.1 hypothetical protein K3726_21055 [Leisingera caerulea]